ncbi:MAG: calcium-binding protein, partial [Hydrogenophaga sp.]|uniref:calcium-binding protein n=1 Tax=Hydrogenophaga sp. TaxID=1904254 RepID=UPI003D9AD7B5
FGDDLYQVDSIGDTVVELLNQGIDTVGSSISYTLGANVEHLILRGSSDLNGAGNELGNRITGSIGNNLLEGLAGNDTLFGGAGDDTLLGGTGTDSLVGGEGNDVLIGGSGRDTLTGGLGADRFVFTQGDSGSLGSHDVITDFRRAQGDVLDLSQFDINPVAPGVQNFVFNPLAPVLGKDATGWLHFADGKLYGSTDADIDAEFVIELTGVTSLRVTDLVLQDIL